MISASVSSELENSGIRVAVGDFSVTERRRWRPRYQTGKTVHVHAKHYKHNEDGHMAPGVCGNGFVPLSHSGKVVTRIGIHTHTSIASLLTCTCISGCSEHTQICIAQTQICVCPLCVASFLCDLSYLFSCNCVYIFM